MLYGLHLSAQGARAQSTRLDVIANNLANASTSAFKRGLAVFQAHKPYDVKNGLSESVPGALNQSTGGTTVAGVYTDRSGGPLVETANQLDVAILGQGYLQVVDGNDQKFVTRKGSFAVNESGELVMAGSGHRVLDEGGSPIALDIQGGPITFAADGTVSQIVNGIVAARGKLAIVQPGANDPLEAIGGGLYRPASEMTPAENATIRQGVLEGSGVQPVKEMLSMIEASRTFETNINMLKFQDEALGRLLQSVPNR